MKRLSAVTALLIMVASVVKAAEGGTLSLLTNPIVVVSPMALDFGVVPSKTTVTNTFLVENAGGGRLVGKATVQPPFKIVSGGDYKLGQNAAQVVTITYTPSTTLASTQTVTFTGGSGAKAAVSGKGGPPRANQPLRR